MDTSTHTNISPSILDQYTSTIVYLSITHPIGISNKIFFKRNLNVKGEIRSFRQQIVFTTNPLESKEYIRPNHSTKKRV